VKEYPSLHILKTYQSTIGEYEMNVTPFADLSDLELIQLVNESTSVEQREMELATRFQDLLDYVNELETKLYGGDPGRQSEEGGQEGT
jgi:hypothetical protein